MKPDHTLCALFLDCTNAEMALRCLTPRVHDPDEGTPLCFKPEPKEGSCDENI